MSVNFINRIIDKIKINLFKEDFIVTRKIANQIFKFFISHEIELWRSNTILTKEPETIEWINNFKKKEIFYDVGANVGIYSLFASKKEIKTLAFEPAFHNFRKLKKNIKLNKVNNCKPYSIALSNKNYIKKFYFNSIQSGTSEKISEDNILKKKFIQKIKFSKLDTLIFQKGFVKPNHIKIDVDGNELNILKGAKKILKKKYLKSILIEISFNKRLSESPIPKILKRNGFKLIKKGKKFAGIESYTQNIIFMR